MDWSAWAKPSLEGHISEGYRSTRYTSGNQVINGLSEWFAIVHRIDPEHGIIRNRKARVFEAHQRDVIDKREIAGNPPAGLSMIGAVKHAKDNANFDALAPVLKLQISPERSRRTRPWPARRDHGYDRPTRRPGCGHQIRVSDVFPGVDNLRVGERPAVCQHLNGVRASWSRHCLRTAIKSSQSIGFLPR